LAVVFGVLLVDEVGQQLVGLVARQVEEVLDDAARERTVLLAVVGIVMVIPVLVDYFQTGLVMRFPTLFVSLFLLLAALLSLFTGLCLDVMVEKDRKQYEMRVIAFGERR
jgi:hypothetical protein